MVKRKQKKTQMKKKQKGGFLQFLVPALAGLVGSFVGKKLAGKGAKRKKGGLLYLPGKK